VNLVHQAALDLQEAIRTFGWPYCFIGGLVVPRWGVERATQDADITVLTQFVHDEECITGLLGRFAGRHADTADLARRARVLLLKHENGIALDIALGALDFEARSIERGSPWKAEPNVELFTCSAEDLIVHKAFAGRDRDWADVESILSVQRERLKVAQILEELTPLAELKEDATIIPRLERMLREHGMAAG
jgi:hypothetical protein